MLYILYFQVYNVLHTSIFSVLRWDLTDSERANLTCNGNLFQSLGATLCPLCFNLDIRTTRRSGQWTGVILIGHVVVKGQRDRSALAHLMICRQTI